MKKLKEKSWPMSPQQTFIAAAIFVVSLFSILFLTAVGDKLLCWINNNSGLASWIQAVGSIGAILASAWITRNYFIKAELDKEERAARQFVMIYLELNAFFINWKKVHEKIIEKGDVSKDSLVMFLAIIQEEHKLLSETRLEDLSHAWARVGMRTRQGTTNLRVKLEKMIEIHDYYFYKIRASRQMDKENLRSERRQKFYLYLNEIVDLKLQFEDLQKYLIANSQEKGLYYSPIQMKDRIWFEEFIEIENIKLK